MSQIDEIKNRLDIVEIIQGYLQLKQAGANFRASCPFHQEKTPSFMVSRDKQIWHCFGCNEGGDVFKFVMKMEGLEFKDALKFLADKAGVKLERYNSAAETQRARLIKICEMAALFFHGALLKNPNARVAREYLKNRGITREIAEDFKIGFALNEWEALNKFLVQQGFREADIFATGITFKKSTGFGYLDRFRARIMIPIADVHGRMVGFTGRLMPSEEKNPKAGGKYVNTPQTLIYDKSRILYGLNKAKQSIREKDAVIIVEGNMDVVTCHQFGFKNVVASSGTALTIEHIKLLKRFTKNLFLSFDADLAGETAAKRGIDNALKEEMNIKVIQIPEGYGKDPDDCIRKNPEAWKNAVESAKDIMDYYFEKATKNQDLKKLEVQQKIRSIIIPEINKIQDGVARVFWLKKLAEVLGVQEDVIHEEFKRFQGGVVARRSRSRDEAAPRLYGRVKSRQELLSEQLLAILLASPQNLSETTEVIKSEMLPQNYSFLYTNFLSCYNNKGTLEYSVLKEYLVNQQINDETKNLFFSITMLSERDFKSLELELRKDELLKVLKELKLLFIKKQRENLEKEMKEAERAEDIKRVKELAEKFNTLL
ncbi:MAG: DNA primase [Patescibacteria group bacterium]|nr:DNA primase [Patescibacteria group bacterium]